jgi:dipeptidyl aminopeptidase/acylaminoacyl peptidase
MTGPRDTDRLIRAFLAEGPATLPDRSVDGVLAAISRTGRPVGVRPWLGWRPARETLLAFAAAVAAVVVATSFFVFGPTLPVGIVSSPTPTAPSAVPTAASPSASPSPIESPQGADGQGLLGGIVYELRDASGRSSIHAGARLLASDACCAVLSPTTLAGPDGSATRPAGEILVYGSKAPDGRYTGVIRDRRSSDRLTILNPPPNVAVLPRAVATTLDIAFEGWSDAFAALTGIYVSNAGDAMCCEGRVERLTTAPVGWRDVPVRYSPDGTRLLFVRIQPSENDSGPRDLYVIDTDGTGLRQLNSTEMTLNWRTLSGPGAAWSPDGGRVVFSEYDRPLNRSFIVVADPKSGSVEVRSDIGLGTAGPPDWSPDGSWIVFDRYDRGNASGLTHRRLELIHPDGTGLKFLTQKEFNFCCARWNPNGTALVAYENVSLNGLFYVPLTRSFGNPYPTPLEFGAPSSGYATWAFSWAAVDWAAVGAAP